MYYIYKLCTSWFQRKRFFSHYKYLDANDPRGIASLDTGGGGWGGGGRGRGGGESGEVGDMGLETIRKFRSSGDAVTRLRMDAHVLRYVFSRYGMFYCGLKYFSEYLVYQSCERTTDFLLCNPMQS